jgi:hypothetical protein
MRWFKHYADARLNPKLKHVQKQLGEAGYARAFKLLEVIAQRGGKADNFCPEVNLGKACTDLAWLAEELGIVPAEARKTLKVFAQSGLIESEALKHDIIRVPQMTEYLDEWTGRQHRSNSRVAAEPIPSSSEQSQSERRADGEPIHR